MTKQEEQLEFIEVAHDLNAWIHRKHGVIEDRFYYSTDGYTDIFGFGSKVLWCSADDNRELIEGNDEYESFKPFIIRVFNIWVESISKLKL